MMDRALYKCVNTIQYNKDYESYDNLSSEIDLATSSLASTISIVPSPAFDGNTNIKIQSMLHNYFFYLFG